MIVYPKVVPTEEEPVMGKVVEKEKIVPTEEEPVMGKVVVPNNNTNVIQGNVFMGTVVGENENTGVRQSPNNRNPNLGIKYKPPPRHYNLPDDREEDVISQIIWLSLESVLNLIALPFYIIYCIGTILEGVDGGAKGGNNDTRNMYLIVKNMNSGQIEFLKLDEIPDEQREKIMEYMDKNPCLEATIERGEEGKYQIKDENGQNMDTLPHDKPVCVKNPKSINAQQFLGKILEQNENIWVRDENYYHNSLISQPVDEGEWQEKYASTAKKVIEYVTSQEEVEEYKNNEETFKKKFKPPLTYEYVPIVREMPTEGGRKQTKHKKKSKTKKRSKTKKKSKTKKRSNTKKQSKRRKQK